MNVVISDETARAAATQLAKLPYRKVASLIQMLLSAQPAPTLVPAPEPEPKAKPEA